MKRNYKYIPTFFILLFIFPLNSSIKAQNIDTTNFVQTLADSLGADDHGMKVYTLVLLKTGTKKIKNKILLDSLFRGHMANINKLANEGKLIVAGPIVKNKKSYRGLFILNTKSIEQAKALLNSDPTITSKVLIAEIYNWYGSAALPTYLPNHKKIEKVRF